MLELHARTDPPQPRREVLRHARRDRRQRQRAARARGARHASSTRSGPTSTRRTIRPEAAERIIYWRRYDYVGSVMRKTKDGEWVRDDGLPQALERRA